MPAFFICLSLANRSGTFTGVDHVRAFLMVKSNDLRIGYSSHLSAKLLAVMTQLQLRNDDSLQIKRELACAAQMIWYGSGEQPITPRSLPPSRMHIRLT
jgi:hypothetical protein